jgi:hypothetical protein
VLAPANDWLAPVCGTAEERAALQVRMDAMLERRGVGSGTNGANVGWH